MASEIAVVPNDQFLAFQPQQQATLGRIRENLGPGGMQPHELDTIRVPTSGGMQWTLPVISGNPLTHEFKAVPIHKKDVRILWNDKLGEIPLCKSDDMVRGVGVPGGDCTACPLARAGSKVRADGKPTMARACQERRILFLLRPGELLPTALQLPVMATRASRLFFNRILQTTTEKFGALRWDRCVIEFGLTHQHSSEAGVDYSVPTFSVIGYLDDEQYAASQRVAEAFAGAIAQVEPEQYEESR